MLRRVLTIYLKYEETVKKTAGLTRDARLNVGIDEFAQVISVPPLALPPIAQHRSSGTIISFGTRKGLLPILQEKPFLIDHVRKTMLYK